MNVNFVFFKFIDSCWSSDASDSISVELELS